MDSTFEHIPREIKLKHNPELKSVLRNMTETGITTGIWIIWSYLLLPIINVILWVLGFRILYLEFDGASYGGLILLLQRLGWVVLIVFATLQLWGYYNYHMFGKKNRRKERSFDTIAELVRHFNMTPEEIAEMQSRKEIVIWSLKK